MKTLRSPDKFVTASIPMQHIEEGIEYHISPYVIVDGSAMYNCLTDEAVLVEDDIKDKKTLIAHWFYTPKVVDPSSAAYVIRQKRIGLNNRPGAALKRSYVIFTTTACNASCTYCFEKGLSPLSMTEETAVDVAKYIKKTRVDERIKIKWFGGEPLLNKKAINVICDNLRQEEIKYWCEISSNGDLFPTCTGSELINWNPRVVQFTVDDIEENYDRIKGLPAGAYERLKDTISRFESFLPHCRINIRVHLNPEKNPDICYKIVDDFSSFSNTRIYPRLLYGKESEEDYTALMKIEDYIVEKGKHGIYTSPFHYGSHCMADNTKVACITPDGHLSPCEHYAYGEHMYGSIYSDEKNKDILRKWSVREKYQNPDCKTCPLYPSCRKIVMCPAEGKCSDGYQYYQIETIKRALRKKVEELNGGVLK